MAIGGVPSFRMVEIPTGSSSPFNVDKEKLMQLAESKNHEMLSELGGVDGIISSLKTRADYGIRGDAADLRNRIEFFESNPRSSIIRGLVYRYLLAILRRFIEFSFLSLCACCVYLIIVGIKLYGWDDGWQDGAYSFVFTFIIAVISATIETGVGAYLDKAIKGSQLVIVLRNGLKQQIPVSSILVGDIVILTKGDRIPADGLLLEASGYPPLKLEESQDGMMVEIIYSDPFLRAGARVLQGKAKMMVTSTVVGTNTNGIYEITELRAQIDYLVRLVEIMKWLLAMSSFLISFSRYISGKVKDDEGYKVFDRETTSTLEVSYMIGEYIVAASVIFVAMDTDNFSWALKVCFSHAINMMAASNVIVRNLRSWEKIGLGVATINVTDELNAFNRLMSSNFLFVPQITANKEDSSHVSPDVLQLLRQGIGLNTTGISNHAQHKCRIKFLGSPSERAFLSQAALESNTDWEKLMNECAIVRVENLENQGRVILVKKDDSFLEHRRGPAEVILTLCSGYYDDAGIQHPLDEDTRSLLEQKLQSSNSDSRTQVVALAYRHLPNRELKDDSNSDKNEDCYNLLGFVVLKEANQGETVEDVVQKVNLDDVAELRETEMNSDATNLETAVPSEATESISMGIQGDEAKRTSDIVILDGKITTLSLILQWAKGMLLNTRAFTQFQLTVMIAGIADAFVRLVLPVKTAGLNKELAYQVVQQTWVNTGMGLIAFITFGRQQPRRPVSVTLPQQPPEDGKIWLMTGYMLRNIMTQSAYQITAVGVLQFKGTIFGFSDEASDTTTFVVSIFLQVLNMISARKIEEKNIFSGIRLRFVGLVTALMVVPFVLVEILARIGYFGRLDGKQWATCIAIALVSWPVGLASKFVPVRLFAILVRLVAVPMMALAYRSEELWNWIKSVVFN